MSDGEAKPVWHIENRVLHCKHCDGEPLPAFGYFLGLDAAYGAVMTGYGATPCIECVKAAAFAMGVPL